MTHSQPLMPAQPIAVIGFGEAGQAFAKGWQQAMGDLGLLPGKPDLGARADAILDALGQLDNHEKKDD